jgi:hypothetical protein
MSDNTYNRIIPTTIDPNHVIINDLKIEFKKHYIREFNDFQTNKHYNYSPVFGTSYEEKGTLPQVEFYRKDALGYIKMKNQDKWLYEKNNNLIFTDLHCGTFDYQQPLVVWFEYVREREVIIFKRSGYNVEKVMTKIWENVSNLSYLHYNQDGGNVQMKWVDNRNDATKFYYDKVKWNEISWIKLRDPTSLPKDLQ